LPAITRLHQVLAAIHKYPSKRVSVAVAEDPTVLEALREAREQEIGEPILVGDEPEIRRIAEEVNYDLTGVEVIQADGPVRAAECAAKLVRDERADIVMKGHLHTDDFLRAILNKETGLRSGAVMSHVFILETTHLDRLTFVTDGAMNIAPDLTQKADIILNAVYLANVFGIECPKVAIVCAIELLNPKMPATLEAAALGVMSRRRQFPNCLVGGPLALDNAVSVVAARHKRIESNVAGEADILLMPSIEAGNMLAKSFTYFAQGLTAGVLLGAAAPVVLTSRADSAEAKLYSIATAVLTANIQRHSRLKLGKVHY
jgi:phosphate butyryltransferase